MPWALLLDLRVLLGIALIAVGVYAKIQTVRMEEIKAEYAQFRADVESEAAKAKVAAARQEALQATHATEALDALQGRLNAVSMAYRRLRDANATSRLLPSLSQAASSLGSCPGNDGKPDAVTRRLEQIEAAITGVLEIGDTEIGKAVEHWQLQLRNSGSAL